MSKEAQDLYFVIFPTIFLVFLAIAYLEAFVLKIIKKFRWQDIILPPLLIASYQISVFFQIAEADYAPGAEFVLIGVFAIALGVLAVSGCIILPFLIWFTSKKPCVANLISVPLVFVCILSMPATKGFFNNRPIDMYMEIVGVRNQPMQNINGAFRVFKGNYAQEYIEFKTDQDGYCHLDDIWGSRLEILINNKIYRNIEVSSDLSKNFSKENPFIINISHAEDTSRNSEGIDLYTKGMSDDAVLLDFHIKVIGIINEPLRYLTGGFRIYKGTDSYGYIEFQTNQDGYYHLKGLWGSRIQTFINDIDQQIIEVNSDIYNNNSKENPFIMSPYPASERSPIIKNDGRYAKEISDNNKRTELAANEGDPYALYYRGLGYKNKHNPQEAFKWFHLAATKGSPDAKFMLYKCYYHGTGVKSDRKKASYWLEQAAKDGHWSAQKYINAEQVRERLQAANLKPSE